LILKCARGACCTPVISDAGYRELYGASVA
jgi:hypothetical protein